MAALLRALAGSGRNVQGTAAPVHSLSVRRRYAGRAAESICLTAFRDAPPAGRFEPTTNDDIPPAVSNEDLACEARVGEGPRLLIAGASV